MRLAAWGFPGCRCRLNATPSPIQCSVSRTRRRTTGRSLRSIQDMECGLEIGCIPNTLEKRPHAGTREG